jgi:hypothetical protein
MFNTCNQSRSLSRIHTINNGLATGIVLPVNSASIKTEKDMERENT